jgi:hypothetical protein
MGFRFRRSIRLAPGLRVNLSKSGPSLNVGRRNSTVNFGPRGTRLTVGLPGTGISYSTKLSRARPSYRNSETPTSAAPIDCWPVRSGRPRLALIGGGLVAVLLVVALVHGERDAPPATEAIPAAAAATIAPAAEPSTPAAPSTATPDTVVVERTEYLRDGPGRGARVRGVVRPTEEYRVFGRSGSWVQIAHDAPVGWVGAAGLKG